MVSGLVAVIRGVMCRLQRRKHDVCGRFVVADKSKFDLNSSVAERVRKLCFNKIENLI